MNFSEDEPRFASIAKSMLSNGLCVLPARRDQKRPALAGWKKYQTQLPRNDEIERWFAGKSDAVCIVAGRISGNIELMDFDRGGELFDVWFESIAPEIRSRLIIESSQSGGRHVIYRCEKPVDGNLKLAQRMRDGKLFTLIETRGEGGLFLCAPSAGYEITQGDLCSPPVLTASERESLLLAAWNLNESKPQRSAFHPVDDLRPGDDYNERGNVTELLKSHGWKPGETHADGNHH